MLLRELAQRGSRRLTPLQVLDPAEMNNGTLLGALASGLTRTLQAREGWREGAGGDADAAETDQPGIHAMDGGLRAAAAGTGADTGWPRLSDILRQGMAPTPPTALQAGWSGPDGSWTTGWAGRRPGGRRPGPGG